DTPRSGIAARARIAHPLDQLLHDMLRRRHVGGGHARIDNVVATRARLRFELVYLLEDVRREPSDSVGIVVYQDVPPTPTEYVMPNGWAFEPQNRLPGQ